MKPLILLCCLAVMVSSCDRSNTSSAPFVGTWRRVSIKMVKGDPKIDQGYEPVGRQNLSYLVVKDSVWGLIVSQIWSDQSGGDKCDSVSVDGQHLFFRKINQNRLQNHYSLRLDTTEAMKGEMKSFNGNTYEVTYRKMPDDFVIEQLFLETSDKRWWGKKTKLFDAFIEFLDDFI